MRKRWIVLGTAGVVIAAALAVAFWPEPREPQYKGKKLSEWLASQPASPEDVEAVQHIGRDAVPWLLTWLNYEEPRWRLGVVRFYARHPDWIGQRLLIRSSQPEVTMAKRRLAVAGFAILRERAEGAVPELTNMAENSDRRYTSKAVWAMQCLACLGPRAFPPILRAVGDTNRPVARRMSAMTALRNMTYLGTNAIPAIPVLVNCMLETNGIIRGTAGGVLEVFCYPLTSSFVATGGRLEAPIADPTLRRTALRALADMATNDLAFAVASKGTNDPDPGVQAEAVRALARREAYQAKKE